MHWVLAQHFPGEEWIPVGLWLLGLGTVSGLFGSIGVLSPKTRRAGTLLGGVALLLGLAQLRVLEHTHGDDLGSLLRHVWRSPIMLLVILPPLALGALALGLALRSVKKRVQD